jgi:hypothetical protein
LSSVVKDLSISVFQYYTHYWFSDAFHDSCQFRDYRLKKELLSTETDFWRRAARTSKILKVRNEVIREKMGGTQPILERKENNMLKWYGHVFRMEDNRWRKCIMTWSRKEEERRKT